MKKLFILGMLIGLAMPLLGAENALDVFNRGNTLYAQGNYGEAAAAYELLVAQGRVNAALFYNLGNACYRNHQIGHAILNYERAARLSPRDRDIRDNLAFTRALVKEPAPGFPASLGAAAASAAGINELAVVVSALFLILGIGLCGYILSRYRPLIPVNLGLALAWLAAAGWLALAAHYYAGRDAIIVAGPAEARNGPGLENSVGFVVPEGRTVTVMGRSGDWIAVGLAAEGLTGWMPSTAAGLIDIP